TRLNGAKCALSQTVQAFAGAVNFGLATYPFMLSGCPGGACSDACTDPSGSCSLSSPTGLPGFEGQFYGCSVDAFANTTPTGCGNTPDCAGTEYPSPFAGGWRNGANIVVDMLRDPTWDPGSKPPSNVSELLSWFDGDCTDSRELFA